MEDDVHPTPRAGPTTAMPPRAHPGRPLHAVWAPLVGPAPWPEPSPNAWATSGSSEPGAPIRSQQALGPRHLLLVRSSQGLEGHSEHVTRGGRGPRPETGCGPPGHPLTSRRSLRGGGQWAPRQPACRTREVTPETQQALGVTWGQVTADGTSDCLQWWGGGVYLTRAETPGSGQSRRQVCAGWARGPAAPGRDRELPQQPPAWAGTQSVLQVCRCPLHEQRPLPLGALLLGPVSVRRAAWRDPAVRTCSASFTSCQAVCKLLASRSLGLPICRRDNSVLPHRAVCELSRTSCEHTARW